ncbi:hypothetical protein [Streptomyces sp. enrichment culture]|uniref:hypothetical protein n=1 Tax=Streptomyces sp. enrichment culture TaxID=1795815 RepID=UPI003F56C607
MNWPVVGAAPGRVAADRFVVLGGYRGPDGVRRRLGRLMPGCDVREVTPGGDPAADADRVLRAVEGLRR